MTSLLMFCEDIAEPVKTGSPDCSERQVETNPRQSVSETITNMRFCGKLLRLLNATEPLIKGARVTFPNRHIGQSLQ